MVANDNEKLLVYFESEEHLVRRLGAAVISIWSSLDKSVREELIERAKRVLDDDCDDQLDQSIRTFITVHDRMAARASCAPPVAPFAGDLASA